MAKTTVKAETSPKATPAKKAATKKASVKQSTFTDSGAEAQYRMIQDAAYFIAERNNFAGDPHAFWVQAEAQISGMVAN